MLSVGLICINTLVNANAAFVFIDIVIIINIIVINLIIFISIIIILQSSSSLCSLGRYLRVQFERLVRGQRAGCATVQVEMSCEVKW